MASNLESGAEGDEDAGRARGADAAPEADPALDSDSASESDDSADEAAEIERLERAVASEDSASAHAALIEKLRSAGELERLRAAREAFASKFELGEADWIAWVEDESKLGGDLADLNARALKSYPCSVDLWQRRLAASKPPAAREDYQEAARSAGFNVRKGVVIWNAWQTFEESNGDVGTKLALAEERVQCPILDAGLMASLLRLGMSDDDAKAAMARGEEQKKLAVAADAYERRLEQHYPESEPASRASIVSALPEGLADVWIDYVEAMQQQVRRRMSQVWAQRFLRALFDRAVSICGAHSPALWEGYISFCRLHLRDLSLAEAVAERALRPCHGILALWRERLCVGEQRVIGNAEALVEQVSSITYRGLSAGMASQDLCDFLLSSCHVYRRCAVANESHHALQDQLDKQFAYSITVLRTMFPGEPALRLRVVEEYTRCLCQSELFTDGGPSGAAVGVARAWEDFEAKYGTLETLEEAQLQAARTLSLRERVHSTANVRPARTKPTKRKALRRDDAAKNANVSGTGAKKLKREGALPARTSENENGDLVDGVTRMEIEGNPSDAQVSEKSGHQGAHDEGSSKMETDSTHPSEDAQAKSAKREAERERSVFVINLSYKSSEEAIRQHFSTCGKVLRVMMKRNMHGQFKGQCTVVYKARPMAEAAFAQLQGVPLEGRALQLREVKAPGERRQLKASDTATTAAAATPEISAEQAPRTVHVTGLPPTHCSEEELKHGTSAFAEALRACGEIEAVSLAGNRASADVRFTTAKSADEARTTLHKKSFAWPKLAANTTTNTSSNDEGTSIETTKTWMVQRCMFCNKTINHFFFVPFSLDKGRLKFEMFDLKSSFGLIGAQGVATALEGVNVLSSYVRSCVEGCPLKTFSFQGLFFLRSLTTQSLHDKSHAIGRDLIDGVASTLRAEGLELLASSCCVFGKVRNIPAKDTAGSSGNRHCIFMFVEKVFEFLYGLFDRSCLSFRQSLEFSCALVENFLLQHSTLKSSGLSSELYIFQSKIIKL
ncbi:Nuclear cap-binding protein subunit 2 [Hondaea fermentalgiana]|uniref:Nuclear cap-binding protein subunit 2 n=1 Tax=Hondaea fermentalgiana TaxID=2315210 RepID=A0A2R5G0Z0_9STRA|nr:Nuclear cap-binding protein subunit 2 [Hondaea fermentalgiana]|eukprot:GBG24672.1 Nuclear cap-binding protein subunit 2 [Hondaea fermentalgiana]